MCPTMLNTMAPAIANGVSRYEAKKETTSSFYHRYSREINDCRAILKCIKIIILPLASLLSMVYPLYISCYIISIHTSRGVYTNPM